MIREKHTALFDINPLDVQRKKIKTAVGNSLGIGLVIQPSRKEQLIAGGNQAWYSFKNMMIEHVSCSTTRNGGLMHYKALVAKKQRRIAGKNLEHVLCNRSKAPLLMVKTKAASLRYENVLALLRSCGADVGNLGHG